MATTPKKKNLNVFESKKKIKRSKKIVLGGKKKLILKSRALTLIYLLNGACSKAKTKVFGAISLPLFTVEDSSIIMEPLFCLFLVLTAFFLYLLTTGKHLLTFNKTLSNFFFIFHPYFLPFLFL